MVLILMKFDCRWFIRRRSRSRIQGRPNIKRITRKLSTREGFRGGKGQRGPLCATPEFGRATMFAAGPAATMDAKKHPLSPGALSSWHNGVRPYITRRVFRKLRINERLSERPLDASPNHPDASLFSQLFFQTPIDFSPVICNSPSFLESWKTPRTTRICASQSTTEKKFKRLRNFQ